MERYNVSGNSNHELYNSWTPLHCAAEAGHKEVVEYFCSQSAFSLESCINLKLISPLHSAAICGKRSVLEYLLNYHGDKFHPDMLCDDFLGSNCLHLAAYHGHIDCCQLLIDDYNLSLTDTTGKGFMAIDLAAASGNLAVVKYIVVNKEYPPLSYLSPLHVAAYYGKASIVSWLLKICGYNPNSLVDYSLTTVGIHDARPLHLAAARGHLNCVQVLVEHDECDVNAKKFNGKPPLAYATSEAVSWELIKAGAAPKPATKIPWQQFLDKGNLLLLAQPLVSKTTVANFTDLASKYQFLQ